MCSQLLCMRCAYEAVTPAEVSLCTPTHCNVAVVRSRTLCKTTCCLIAHCIVEGCFAHDRPHGCGPEPSKTCLQFVNSSQPPFPQTPTAAGTPNLELEANLSKGWGCSQALGGVDTPEGVRDNPGSPVGFAPPFLSTMARS
jgi:hypothetical protein